MKTGYQYQCDYCLMRFKSEKNFMKHRCKDMKREDEFKSLEGQAAHLFYKSWMKKKHHTTMTSADGFKTSQYFPAFIKFVNFAQQAHLPDPNSFIELMVKKKIDPKLWTDDRAYAKYLEWFTRFVSAERLIEITVKTLYEISDDNRIAPRDIFLVLVPNDIIQLLSQRRISPWILLNSKKFVEFYRDKTNSEERVIMESLINPDYWTKRFEAFPDDLKLARECVSQLEL